MWKHTLNLNILFVILNFCANSIAESGNIRNDEKKNDEESNECVSERGYGNESENKNL